MTTPCEADTVPGAVRSAAWMVLAAFSYAVTGALVRHLADDFSVFEVAFFRCVIAVFMIAPLILRSPATSFRTVQLPMHVWRVRDEPPANSCRPRRRVEIGAWK